MSLQFGNVRNLRPAGGFELGSLKLQSNRITFTTTSGKARNIEKTSVNDVHWLQANRRCQLRIWYSASGKTKENQDSSNGSKTEEKGSNDAQNNSNGDSVMRISGLGSNDLESVKKFFKDHFGKVLEASTTASSGVNWGTFDVAPRGKFLNFSIPKPDFTDDSETPTDDPLQNKQLAAEFALAHLSQCANPSKNEVELQFAEANTVARDTEVITHLRLFIPNGEEIEEDSEEPQKTSAEKLQSSILLSAGLDVSHGAMLVKFDSKMGFFLTPRGRYAVEMFENYLRLYGQTYDYKILYRSISRMFLLPHTDGMHHAFAVTLDDPIRKGNQRFQHLIMRLDNTTKSVTVNLTEKEIIEKYGVSKSGRPLLTPQLAGELPRIVAKVFKVLTKSPVYVPRTFKTSKEASALHCSYKTNPGLIYPLESAFFFIHKPPIYIHYTTIAHVEFERYANFGTSRGVKNRTFDFKVTLKDSAIGASSNDVKEYTFSGIEREEYASLFKFVHGKELHIRNIVQPEQLHRTSTGRRAGRFTNLNVDQGLGPDSGDDDDEEEDDGDFNLDEELEQQKEDDEEDGIEGDSDSGEDSDEDYGGSSSSKKKKRKRGSASSKSKKKGGSKKRRKKKDPNAPKRPLSAYMFFSKEHRAVVRKEQPTLSMTEISKGTF
eukprot:g3281.t1